MTVVIILDSLLYNCPVVDSFLPFVFEWLWILSVSLQFLFNRWLFLLFAGFEIEEFSNKMAISFSECQRQIILSQKTDRIRASVLNIRSHSFLFCLLISSYLSLMLSCTVPKFHLVPLDFTWFYCALWSAFGLLRISSFTLSLYSVCPRHHSLWHSLSSYGCSLTLTLTTSIGIWHAAGVTKSWSSVVSLSCSCRISLICRQLPLSSLCHLFWTLTLVVVDSSSFTIEEFVHKMAISWKNVELNRTIILTLQDRMICPSVVLFCSDSWIFCLLISTSLSLLHSPRHNSRRHSLFMRVLSHSDTHHLSGIYGRVRVPRKTWAVLQLTGV